MKDPATKWHKLSQWYGFTEKAMEITTATEVWYHSDKPAVPLRWVLLKDPEGRLAPTALHSTEVELFEEEIVTYFVRRWSGGDL